ncbi:MAG TPA: FkbM family methyltransferase [Chthoniobacterales bacterium]|jgi:FkbM family methyltransferase
MKVRKFLKFVLPWGLVDLARNRRILRGMGRRLKPFELFNSEWVIHEAEQTGLALLPPGYAQHLRYVVDVGANVGEWSEMLLDCINPERLIMVEPGPAVCAELTKKFGSDPRVQINNVAVGEKEGTARLNVTRDTTGASLLNPKPEMRALIGSNWTVTEEVAVPMVTLDRLLSALPEVSLLKIDVQGYEHQALAGAAETLNKTRFLLVELNYMPQYEGGSWFGDLHKTLTNEFGFFLANASKPLCLNGRAAMCDGLYVNPRLVEWVKPDFV